MSTATALRSEPAPPGGVVRLSSRDGGGGAPLASLIPLGMWLALVPIGMLFMAFASAYIVRSGLGTDWVAVPIPALVWINTILLIASSMTLELGRRVGGRVWVWASFLLGAGFLVGQVAAWVQLTGRGVGLGTTPFGSFFYLLTGTHAAHLVLGLAILLAAALWPDAGIGKLSRAGAVGASAIYWHFMDLLWLGILFLLVFGR